ncbi:MAG TPA: hypothetical protein VFV99_12210, partial [Kofleriaceae bacterium]|nr:hypothetical protein [Kofleriaceae bacterium]
MRRVALVLVLSGCFHDAAKPTTSRGLVPGVRFAIAVGKTVQIVRTTDNGLVVERTTPVPDAVSRIVWVGPDPAVWIDMTVGEQGPGFPPFNYDEDPKPPGAHQNEMGLVTASGYVKFKPIAWPAAKRPDGQFSEDLSEVTEPNAALVASKDALWEKRCRWYGGPDGGWCTYEYARRFPEPTVFVAEVDETRALAFPKIPPSATLAVGHKTRPRDPNNTDADSFENNQEVMTCKRAGGEAITYPPAGALDYNVLKDIDWLSTEPPIFVSSEEIPDYSGMGRTPPPSEKIWEGCT